MDIEIYTVVGVLVKRHLKKRPSNVLDFSDLVMTKLFSN